MFGKSMLARVLLNFTQRLKPLRGRNDQAPGLTNMDTF